MLEQNANMLPFGVRKRKLELNAISNSVPQCFHTQRAWQCIKNPTEQWVNRLSQSKPLRGSSLYCNVQHDRLGDKSHIYKITLCGKRRSGNRGGREGYFDLEKGRGAVLFVLCKSSRLVERLPVREAASHTLKDTRTETDSGRRASNPQTRTQGDANVYFPTTNGIEKLTPALYAIERSSPV